MIKIEKIIEILKAMEYSVVRISDYYKREGNLEMEKSYLGELSGYCSAILLLEDEEHAKAMAEIYHIEL